MYPPTNHLFHPAQLPEADEITRVKLVCPQTADINTFTRYKAVKKPQIHNIQTPYQGNEFPGSSLANIMSPCAQMNKVSNYSHFPMCHQ